VARNLAEAHLIAGFLRAEGIPCEVRGEHLMAAYGELPITYETLPSIWVAPQDRLKARQRIEQALHGLASGTRWVCPNCLETIEAQFTECWSCGASRPI
jgi:hypothetical protein